MVSNILIFLSGPEQSLIIFSDGVSIKWTWGIFKFIPISSLSLSYKDEGYWILFFFSLKGKISTAVKIVHYVLMNKPFQNKWYTKS